MFRKALKRFRHAGTGAVPAAALLMVMAAPASAAPRLVVTDAKTPYAGANFTFIQISTRLGAECLQNYDGEATTDKSTVTDVLEPDYQECGGGYSMTGTFTKLHLRWNSQVTTTGKVAMQVPGPCVYQLNGLSGTMTSGSTSVTGSVSGWLSLKESNVSCTLTRVFSWDAGLTDPIPIDGVYHLLESEIWG